MRKAWLSNFSFIYFIEVSSCVRIRSCVFGWMGVCGGGVVSGGGVGGGVLTGDLVRSMVVAGVVGEFFSSEAFSTLTVWCVLLDEALMSLVLFG